MSVTKLVETLIVSLSEFLSKIGSHLLASSGITEKEYWHGMLFKPKPSRPSDPIGL